MARKGYADPPRHATMWRTGRWKLSLYHTCQTAGRPNGELYDMIADPDELNNLWGDPGHAAVRQQLTEAMLAWLVGQQERGRGRGEQALPDGFRG